MMSPRQKACPNCGTPIPKTWDNHYQCGWKGGESHGTNSTGADTGHGTISSSGAAKSLMGESVREVCEVFGLTTEQMRECLKTDSGFSSIINTVFIGKKEARR